MELAQARAQLARLGAMLHQQQQHQQQHNDLGGAGPGGFGGGGGGASKRAGLAALRGSGGGVGACDAGDAGGSQAALTRRLEKALDANAELAAKLAQARLEAEERARRQHAALAQSYEEKLEALAHERKGTYAARTHARTHHVRAPPRRFPSVAAPTLDTFAGFLS